MANARFTLPPLPFKPDALAPAISADTFAQHHAGHHKAYVDKLNTLAGENGMQGASLLQIVRKTADAGPAEVSAQVSAGDIFVHAAQHFNHAFYWKSLSPEGGEPAGALLKAIKQDFKSVDALKTELVAAGIDHFASGWVWLVARDGALSVLSTHDAQCPILDADLKPLLVIDLWEHAYYLDHQKERKAYLEAVVSRHLNWDFARLALAADTVEALDLGIDNAAAKS